MCCLVLGDKHDVCLVNIMEESFNIAMRVKNPTLFPTSCATKLNPDTIWDQRLTYDSRTDFSKLTFDSYLSSMFVCDI